MDTEAQAIMGLANLGIKKFLKPNQAQIPREYLKYLNYAGFADIFHLQVTDGALDLAFERHYPHTPFYVRHINEFVDACS